MIRKKSPVSRLQAVTDALRREQQRAYTDADAAGQKLERARADLDTARQRVRDSQGSVAAAEQQDLQAGVASYNADGSTVSLTASPGLAKARNALAGAEAALRRQEQIAAALQAGEAELASHAAKGAETAAMEAKAALGAELVAEARAQYAELETTLVVLSLLEQALGGPVLRRLGGGVARLQQLVDDLEGFLTTPGHFRALRRQYFEELNK